MDWSTEGCLQGSPGKGWPMTQERKGMAGEELPRKAPRSDPARRQGSRVLGHLHCRMGCREGRRRLERKVGTVKLQGFMFKTWGLPERGNVGRVSLPCLR